jgi:TonB family protein
MKLFTGRRIGQSGQELATAAVFSFALHALTLAAAVFLYVTVTPRVYVPPFYEVKLVGGQPADVSHMPATPAPAPALPKPEEKPVQKGKKAQAKERKAAAKTKKGALPELAKSKPKQARPEQTSPEQTKSVEAPREQRAAPAGGPTVKTENVALTTPQDFKFPPYLAIVREKIGLNWNPPPGTLDTQVKVQFTILRSGRVGDVKLSASSGNFYFDQAAVRAILSSSPFPPLPDGFYKEFEMFSVDLMERD